MKLLFAKAIYYTGIGLMIATLIACLGWGIWGVVSVAPFMLYVVLGFIILVGFGMLFGWAERTIEKDRTYRKKDV